jgi:hypothetical protein
VEARRRGRDVRSRREEKGVTWACNSDMMAMCFVTLPLNFLNSG